MKGSRFSEEQIIGVLREEAGVKTEEVCRRHRISSAIFISGNRSTAGRVRARPNPALGTGGQSRWAAPYSGGVFVGGFPLLGHI